MQCATGLERGLPNSGWGRAGHPPDESGALLNPRVLAAKREAERAKREGDGYQPAAAETIKAKARTMQDRMALTAGLVKQMESVHGGCRPAIPPHLFPWHTLHRTRMKARLQLEKWMPSATIMPRLPSRGVHVCSWILGKACGT